MPETPSTPFSGNFVSYRREDSSGHAGRLFDRLVEHFGHDRIFMDIDTIEPGEDFVTVIENAVASCDILIAVIGRNWLLRTEGTERLDDPNDFVRIEIAAALDRDIRVIPVLVQRATMPLQRDLPPSLARLARRNAVELSDLRWRNDVGHLIDVTERILVRRQEEARFAKAARDAEAKRQSEAEEEKRHAEEKKRLLAEEEAKQRAAEEQRRKAQEQERLIEKRRAEEVVQRQLAEEEAKLRAVKEAQQEAAERERLVLVEKRQAEEESKRQQPELRKAEQEPPAEAGHAEGISRNGDTKQTLYTEPRDQSTDTTESRIALEQGLLVEKKIERDSTSFIANQIPSTKESEQPEYF